MTEAGRRGGTFYDPDLVEAYLRHRNRPILSPNLVMEEPAFLAELGDIRDLRVLDLGCGDGLFGSWCVAAGARSYLGVDGSAAMIDRANDRPPSDRVRYRLADLEDFRAAPRSADLVTSRMTLHYVEDLDPVVTGARRVLADHGRLVISVLHPVISSNRRAGADLRTTVEVDDYFSAGPRHRRWFDRPVVWHHRTVERYVAALLAGGFELTGIRECEPVERLFDGDRAEYERRARVPLFLVLSARPRI